MTSVTVLPSISGRMIRVLPRWNQQMDTLLTCGLLLAFAGSCLADERYPWAEHTAPGRPWQYVVLHHSATEAGSVESIDAAHKVRKDSTGIPWRGIGYHFVIGNGHGMADGEIKSTFRWQEQSAGAHAGESRYNEQGIGICLIGNFQSDRPTDKQLDSLSRLVTHLQQEWQITEDRIVTHGQIKATACPGQQFLLALQRVRPQSTLKLLPASAETVSPPASPPPRRTANSP